MLTASKLGENGYWIESLHKHVFSLEEINFFLYNHIDLVYRDFFCPALFDYMEQELGLADMAKALQTGRKFRANSGQTFHVLEIMEGFAESGRVGHEIPIESRYDLLPLMNPKMEHGVLDAEF